MFYEKLEAFIAACSVLSAIIGGLISNLIKGTKEKAEFVTRDNLDKRLEKYALKEEVDSVRDVVESGFNRMETLYHQDKLLSHAREMATIKRIDEIFNRDS